MSRRLKFDLALVVIVVVAGLLLYRPGTIWYHSYLAKAENPAVRAESLRKLTGMGKRGILATRKVAMGAPDASARSQALDALHQQFGNAHLDLFKYSVSDIDSEVRIKALEILQRTESDRNLPLFLSALKDSDVMVRHEAVRYFGSQSRKEAVPHLVDALDSTDRGLTGAINHALAALTDVEPRIPFNRAKPENFAAMQRFWKEWYDDVGKEIYPRVGDVEPLDLRRDGIRRQMPEFTVADLDGNRHKFGDVFAGPGIVDIWATWCPQCEGGLSELNRHHEELRAQGIAVVALSIDEEFEPVGKYWESHGFSIPVFHSYEALEILHSHHLPLTLILDSQGRIYRRYTGSRPVSVYLEELEYLGGKEIHLAQAERKS